MKRILSIILIINLIFNVALAEFAPAMIIPYEYKKQELREKLITIASSQIDYKESDKGTTVFHHELFNNTKKSNYTYNCPWCVVFLAWCFKKANIYTAVFSDYPATSVKNLTYRFITAGEVNNQISMAFFDESYINNAKPGDIVIYDWKKSEKINNIAEHENFSHVGLIVSKNEENIIKTVEGNFKKKVWTGELNRENKRHNPDKIVGFGVLDLKPEKEVYDNFRTPIIAYNQKDNTQAIIYYIYKDNTCLSSKGIVNTEDYLPNFINSTKIQKASKNYKLYKTPSKTQTVGEIAEGQEYIVISKSANKELIVYESKLANGGSVFPIVEAAWIID